MASHEEVKQFLLKAWESLWSADLTKISEYYTEDAVVSGFTPPKQTTWSGLPAITAHFKEIQPIVSCTSFNIQRLDLVKDGDAFYAAWDGTFHVKIPGQESVMEQQGIIYCAREGGKAGQFTLYEDPTPFVAMAMKGQVHENH